MNPENNIKKFFQSRLKENTPEVEGWNIPSDDIWENAKVHFPQEDKSRRPLLLLLSGLLGLVVLSFLAYTQLTHKQDLKVSDRSISASNVELQKSTSKTLESPALANNQFEDQLISNDINNDLKTSEESRLQNVQTKSDTKSISRQTNNSLKFTETSNTERELKKETSSNELSIKRSIDKSSSQEFNNIILIEKKNSSNDPVALKNSKSDKNVLAKPKTPLSQNIIEKQVALEKIIAKELLSKIPGLPIDLLQYDLNKGAIPAQIIPPHNSNKKWEIGLTTSPFILPLEKLIKEDSTDEGITNVNLKYVGLNIPVTRIINSKWSITSGLYFKKGSLRVSFAEEETLDIGDSISMMFNENSSVASISLQDKTEEITLNLKPDVQIRDGDIIGVNGYGLVDFNVLQIPLLGNYHIRKNRFEYIFSLGASLDLARIAINEFDITLSQQNRIITEPIRYTPLSVDLVDFSLYAGIGTKFHLNESINLSYGIKADVTSVFISTHEIGLHYRF